MVFLMIRNYYLSNIIQMQIYCHKIILSALINLIYDYFFDKHILYNYKINKFLSIDFLLIYFIFLKLTYFL